jgi:hypothetical protein
MSIKSWVKTTKKMFMKKLFFLTMIMAFTVANVNAQDSTKNKHKWTYFGELYLMFPQMSGTSGVGDLPPVTVDINTKDIFSHLKFGTMLYLEATNDKWAVNSDLLYMKLGQSVNASTLINSGDITVKQLGWEVAGLRRVLPWLEVGVGIMLNSLNADVNIKVNNIGGGTTTRAKGLSETWADGLLVARVKNKDGDKFLYQFRGDLGGGFSGDKNGVWQIQAYAGYRFSKLFQVTGGYRIIHLDYEKGTGQDHFLFDMNTSGPVIRFGFNF